MTTAFPLFLFLATQALGTSLPPSLQPLRCKRSEPAKFDSCFLNGLNKSWPALMAGVPEINEAPQDPFHMDYYETDKKLEPLYNFKTILTNLTDRGYAKANNYRFHADLINYGGYIETYIPSKHLETNYETTGRFLGFEALNTEGFAVVDLTNIDVFVVIKFKTIEKNNKQYFQLDQVSMNIRIQKGHIKLTASDQSQQRQADGLANFFNNNNLLVFTVTKELLEEEVTKLFFKYTNPLLVSVPVDDWFLD